MPLFDYVLRLNNVGFDPGHRVLVKTSVCCASCRNAFDFIV